MPSYWRRAKARANDGGEVFSLDALERVVADINVRFDSSCIVLVIEDQWLGDESKCDFTQGAEQVASANRRFLMRCCRLQRTAFA
jgi:hypothetical protein